VNSRARAPSGLPLHPMMPSVATVVSLSLALLATPSSGSARASLSSSNPHHHHHHTEMEHMSKARKEETSSSEKKDQATQHHGLGCVTVEDPRSVGAGWWSQTAKPGSPCVFGATAKDEGSHCVEDFKYGSFGWCYTQKDQSEWGPCSEGCPLYGVHKDMGQEIDGITDDTSDLVKNLTRIADKLPDVPKKKGTKDGHALAERRSAAETGGRRHGRAREGAEAAATSAPRAEHERHEKKSKRGKAAAEEEVSSFAQIAAGSQMSTAQAQLNAAVAFSQHAAQQTDLWTSLAEKVVMTDHDDAPTMAREALERAIKWQGIADRADARVDALKKGETTGQINPHV